MNLSEKITITDFNTLQLEKQRLQIICNKKKSALLSQVDQVRKNYPELILREILPFNERTSDRIFNGLKWIQNLMSEKIFPEGSVFQKFTGSKSYDWIQAVIIYIAFRFIKRFIRKVR